MNSEESFSRLMSDQVGPGSCSSAIRAPSDKCSNSIAAMRSSVPVSHRLIDGSLFKLFL